MSAFDCLVTIGAKTGTQRCQVAAWLYMPLAACPVPFSAKMRMLIAIAIIPSHSKARTNADKTIVSLLQEWACRLLPRHSYDNNTSSRWIWRNFGT